MATIPNPDTLTAQIASLISPLPDLLAQLEQEDVRASALHLFKAQADHHWGIDARISLIVGQTMIAFGTALHDTTWIALGRMAYGDALRFLNRIPEAHQALHEAGETFRAIGDDIGWARTRIGRLLTSEAIGGDVIRTAIKELDMARRIFVRHEQYEFLVRLLINENAFYMRRAEYEAARKALLLGLDIVAQSGSQDHQARLLHNLGILEQMRGRFNIAETHYQAALAIFEVLEQPAHVSLVQSSRATMMIHLGNYREALRLLLALDSQLTARARAINQLNILVCYEMLGAHEQVCLLAERFLKTHEMLHLVDRAAACIHWGNSLAELHNYPAAIQMYDRAEALYHEADAPASIDRVCMQRALVHYTVGNFPSAAADAQRAIASEDVYVQTTANLVMGWLALRHNDETLAKSHALLAFRQARVGMENQRFSVRMLLGNLYEAAGAHDRAARHYLRAHTRVLQLQRDFTIDLRPRFLESHQTALHGVMRVSLAQGKVGSAFQVLEELKALIVAQQLEQRAINALTSADAPLQPLVEAYQAERDRYLWMLNHESEAILTVEERQEKRRIETRLSDFSAEIRLHKPAPRPDNTPFDLQPIVDRIPAQAGIIEYYTDGTTLYAFTLSQSTPLSLTRLYATPGAILSCAKVLRRSIGRALAVGSAGVTPRMIDETLTLLQQMYDAVIRPLEPFTRHHEQLLIVPYGFLHTVPFHLLHDGSRFAVEKFPVVLSPASTLLARRTTRRRAGALILGYHGADATRQLRMEDEAQAIATLLRGTAYTGEAAVSRHLDGTQTSILHIAAHGKNALHQPRLAHLQLADGVLYADDLWRFDMEYDLVTLSACSVGFGYAVGGDEVVGLGHQFLYGGAAALVSSLWEVDDEAAAAFNQAFYRALQSGMSKSEAMRAAQIRLMGDAPFRHPAYWGAFQLIGNPEPLPFTQSSIS
jgi:tetratricopeptide (TPR) repeat protein